MYLINVDKIALTISLTTRMRFVKCRFGDLGVWSDIYNPVVLYLVRETTRRLSDCLIR